MGKGIGRTKQREHIFRMLFGADFNTQEEMPEQMLLYFEQLELENVVIEEEDRIRMQEKCMAILEKLGQIDELLNTSTVGWKTERMNKVDLSILRLAVYEIKWDEDVPTGVAINEAVELAKKFSSEEGPSFINGVLAKMV